MLPAIHQLVTHDGLFHADEVLASVVLTDLFPRARLVRSRDPAWTGPAPGRIVFDVGGIFDPAARAFDHHQADGPLRADGVAFSSFGLIWQEYGRAWLRGPRAAGPEEADALHAILDRSLVHGIDLCDNGSPAPGCGTDHHLSSIIEAFWPDFDDSRPQAMEDAFASALALGRSVLSNRARQAAGRLRAARIVEECLARHDGGPVLVLPRIMPWEDTVREKGADHILFAAMPRGADWTLAAMRKTAGGFESRTDLPAAWGGLEGEALARASGIPEAVFVHRRLFFAVARTREAILRMAEAALEGKTASAA